MSVNPKLDDDEDVPKPLSFKSTFQKSLNNPSRNDFLREEVKSYYDAGADNVSYAGSSIATYALGTLSMPSNKTMQEQEEEMNENIQLYDQHIAAYKTELQDKNQKYNEALAGHISDLDLQLNYSQALKDFHSQTFILSGCSKICFKNIYISPTLEKTQKKTPALSEVSICVNDISTKGLKAFGSDDAYAQGIHVPIERELTGDLKNCIVCEIELSHLYNDLNYPVGVTILHTPHGGVKPVPFREAKFYSPEKCENYHFIIHPNEKTDTKFKIYHTKHTVNDLYTIEYPWLTSDIKRINEGLGVYDDFILVPYIHPVSRYIFENKHKYKHWDLPVPHEIRSSNYGERFQIKRQLFNFCAKKVQEFAAMTIPAVDMSTIRFKFDILTEEKNLRDLKSYKILPEADELTSKKGGDSIKSGVELLYGEKHVGFYANFMYLFRTHIADHENQKQVKDDGVFMEAANSQY